MSGPSGTHGAAGCDEHGQVGEELRLLALALLDRFEPGVQSVLAGLRVEAAEAAAASATDSPDAGPSDAGPSGPAGPGAASDAAPGAAAGAAFSGAAASTPQAACQWCPLCSLIALARGDRPELAGRVAEHASGLLVALRAVLQDRPPTEPSGPPRVQRIEVDRADPGAGGGC